MINRHPHGNFAYFVRFVGTSFNNKDYCKAFIFFFLFVFLFFVFGRIFFKKKKKTIVNSKTRSKTLETKMIHLKSDRLF